MCVCMYVSCPVFLWQDERESGESPKVPRPASLAYACYWDSDSNTGETRMTPRVVPWLLHSNDGPDNIYTYTRTQYIIHYTPYAYNPAQYTKDTYTIHHTHIHSHIHNTPYTYILKKSFSWKGEMIQAHGEPAFCLFLVLLRQSRAVIIRLPSKQWALCFSSTPL